MNSCIFCQITKHEAPAHIVHEDELVMAILDIDPISDGHTLIIPKKDVRDLHSLDSETGKRVMEIAKMLAGAIEQEFEFDGSMIMEVNGAFQEVPHFHLHVFGRNKNNDIEFRYPKNTNSDDEHLGGNAKRLQQLLALPSCTK
jgi:histidine triad (HIT) family protein